ncbi:TonB-dependent receptor [Terriglobus roseus]|uniref:TonB-dependent Receptor Plug Domain n=1 Tax=Terriglobus roseus TaxID=392734 RepID=A0A1H4IYB5_9BACT|nr:TonB-dependent receptor [Terriglobus roseus]SEB38957.1 TonB-dependent Receptor Plug Domain [Terriglobus roseus]
MKRSLLCLSAVLVCTGPSALSQTITGSINGTVTDASGAVLPGAKVIATNVQTNVSSTTESTSSGVYNLRFLQVGQYKVTIQANGFAPQTLGPFALEAGQDAKFDAKLGAEGGTQTVNVTEALVPLLNTESAELGSTLDSHAIDNIPLQGRNFSSLTIFTPGAVATDPTSFTGTNAIERSTGGGGQVSVNGNRQQSNNFLLDGIEINETINNSIGFNPSPDALDQVRTVSANAQAEYGNVNGGDVIALTKSGTNQFHGSGFYYVNDDSFNANTWSNNHNTTPTPKSSATSNIFGGTFGGPILKDKLFFFADYSGNRYHTGGTSAVNVATAKMRAGDFSELLDPTLVNKTIQLYNTQVAGSPAYVNNRLPVTALNPVARYLFAHPELYPLPNQAAQPGTLTNGNYRGVTKQRIYNDQFDVKVDYRYHDKDTFFVRYSQSTAGDTNTAPIALAFPTASTYPTKGVAINYVHTFTPTIQNELRVGFFRTAWHQGLPQDTTGVFGLNGNSLLGISGGNQVPGFSAQNITSTGSNLASSSGGSAFGNAGIYSDNIMNNFTYGDNLTVQKGSHVIKMGAQFIRYQQNSLYTGNDGAQGQMTYNGNYTAANGSAGFGVADFYLDRAATAGRGTLAGHTGQRQWRDAVFAQDDWKVSSTFTLNLGVRWEYDQPIYEVNNKQANLNLQTGAIQLAGVNGNSRALYNPVWTNFMPRVGFSWNPQPRLVLRGGFGSTTYMEGSGANLRLNINPPFQSSVSYTGSAPSGTSLGSYTTAENAFAQNTATCAYSTNPACGQLFRAWDPNLKPSTVNEYSLTSEYQLSNTSSVQIGYVGEYGYHLIQAVNANQPYQPCLSNGAVLAVNDPACFAVNKTPYYQVVGQSGRVALTASQSMMNYNALQASFRQRLKGGLQFTANYAYGKSMTNSIGFFGVSGVQTNSAYAEDPRNNTIEYGPAGTDVRHNINFTMTYDLPVGRGRMLGGNMPRIADEVVGGWKLAVSGFVYSGFPTTITSSNINSGVNSFQQRMVKLRPLHIVNRSVGHWFGTDPSATSCTTPGVDNGVCAYGLPANGVVSQQRPGTERTPGYQQYDASLFKDFNITERQHISLRADGTNVFNIASYGNPDSTAQDASFGNITNTRSGPRQLQISAKYVF